MSWSDLDALVSPHGWCLAQFDPLLVYLSDAGNLMTMLAYLIGFPFAMFRLIDHLPRRFSVLVALAIAFVFLCGLSHLFDLVVVHRASYLIYLLQAWNTMATGVVSWGFVMAVNWATQKSGLRVVVDESG